MIRSALQTGTSSIAFPIPAFSFDSCPDDMRQLVFTLINGIMRTSIPEVGERYHQLLPGFSSGMYGLSFQ